MKYKHLPECRSKDWPIECVVDSHQTKGEPVIILGQPHGPKAWSPLLFIPLISGGHVGRSAPVFVAEPLWGLRWVPPHQGGTREQVVDWQGLM